MPRARGLLAAGILQHMSDLQNVLQHTELDSAFRVHRNVVGLCFNFDLRPVAPNSEFVEWSYASSTELLLLLESSRTVTSCEACRDSEFKNRLLSCITKL